MLTQVIINSRLITAKFDFALDGATSYFLVHTWNLVPSQPSNATPIGRTLQFIIYFCYKFAILSLMLSGHMGKYLMKVALLKQHPEDKCTTFPK